MRVSDYIKQKTGFEFPNVLKFQNLNDMKNFIEKINEIYEQVKFPNVVEIRKVSEINISELESYYSLPYIDINLIMEEGAEIKTFVPSTFALSSYYLVKNGSVIDYFKDLNSLKSKKIKNRLVVFKESNVWRQVTKIDFIKEYGGIYKIYFLLWGTGEYYFKIKLVDFKILQEKIRIVDSLENKENQKIKQYLFKGIDSELNIKDVK